MGRQLAVVGLRSLHLQSQHQGTGPVPLPLTVAADQGRRPILWSGYSKRLFTATRSMRPFTPEVRTALSVPKLCSFSLSLSLSVPSTKHRFFHFRFPHSRLHSLLILFLYNDRSPPDSRQRQEDQSLQCEVHGSGTGTHWPRGKGTRTAAHVTLRAQLTVAGLRSANVGHSLEGNVPLQRQL